jgi:hypothetical protein
MARNYMGDLVLAVLVHASAGPSESFAIAVPERGTFTNLLARIRPVLERLGTGAYVVPEGGGVTEVVAPAML